MAIGGHVMGVLSNSCAIGLLTLLSHCLYEFRPAERRAKDRRETRRHPAGSAASSGGVLGTHGVDDGTELVIDQHVALFDAL